MNSKAVVELMRSIGVDAVEAERRIALADRMAKIDEAIRKGMIRARTHTQEEINQMAIDMVNRC